ncbi:histidine decarboxylase [Flavobacterium jejuense]|uniref:Histidine decarboxylase n=1 Tax=Flavobacterium jejuense TaxID=1544455 RepID=A0ABX0IK63_9FLAO|nr:pyridoxal-dependent decarboxylase [Flavobacterium jejuense]NHN24217.1 histidine decarboxylase [Flavobacterium jejuense]
MKNKDENQILLQQEENLNEQRKSYWTPKSITFEDVQLSDNGISPDQRKRALNQLSEYVKDSQENFLGYQATQRMDFSEFSKYLDVSINNLGDSFSSPKWDSNQVPPDGYFRMNDKWIERAVLDYYAKLWNAKSPRLVEEDKEEGWLETYWGYILTMGSTEGNLLAMRNGRDYLNGTLLQYDPKPQTNTNNTFVNKSLEEVGYVQAVQDETNLNALTPVLFYSEATHYSIKKLAQVLQIKTFAQIAIERGFENPFTEDRKWPNTIPIDKTGAIKVDELVKYATFFIQKGFPILVNFNYGTTWTGAYDDVGEAVAKLKPVLDRFGMFDRKIRIRGKEYERNGFWYHVDGALGAAFVPFIKNDVEDGDEISKEFPDFDFKLHVHSISTSGHKWVGMPWPCGIYMTKNKYLISNDVPDYVGSLDSTLAGSRNGFSALLMWDYLSKRSKDDLKAEVLNALKTVEYTKGELEKIYPRKVLHVPGSLVVIFPKPTKIDIIKKYSLASSGNFSHIFIMRHVTEEMIDNLIIDLKKNLLKEEPLLTSKTDNDTVDHSFGW